MSDLKQLSVWDGGNEPVRELGYTESGDGMLEDDIELYRGTVMDGQQPVYLFRFHNLIFTDTLPFTEKQVEQFLKANPHVEEHLERPGKQ